MGCYELAELLEDNFLGGMRHSGMSDFEQPLGI